MKRILVDAMAKINLSLDVLAGRQDGYHDIRMIMQSVALHDDVSIERSGVRAIASNDGEKSTISVSCRAKAGADCGFTGDVMGKLPEDSRNTAFKAARLFLERHGIPDDISIEITKRIPVAAGLGGGSADAAAVIKGLDALFGTGLSDAELLEIAACAGSDVPFCITGGTMLAEGRGEKLSRIVFEADWHIVIVKPGFKVSTAWAYSLLDVVPPSASARPATNGLLEALSKGRKVEFARGMKNVFENVISKTHSEILEIKEALVSLGAAGAMMSGSGPSVFGLFDSASSAGKAVERLVKGGAESRGWAVWQTGTASEGISLRGVYL